MRILSILVALSFLAPTPAAAPTPTPTPLSVYLSTNAAKTGDEPTILFCVYASEEKTLLCFTPEEGREIIEQKRANEIERIAPDPHTTDL